MSYTLVSVPAFAKKEFFSFTKGEAKQYLQWFLDMSIERQQILKSNVNELYPEWNFDYNPQSLNNLYDWFKKRVAYRAMTAQEKESVQNQISNTPLFVNIIPIPESAFTDETVSICFDIGIYLGEILIKNIDGVIWSFKVSSTSFIYYAQPLLIKNDSKFTVNPRASVEGIARRVLDKDANEISFGEFYNRLTEKFD